MRWIRLSLGPSPSCQVICAIAGLMVAMAASAQSPVAFNRDVIVLDPAHGGTDGGARINDHLEEKDVTLAIAARVRSLLAVRGFTVVSTRQDDLAARSGAPLSSDQRAEAANRVRAVACLVLHASASGNGVYLGVSAIGSPLAAVPKNVGKASAAANMGVSWDRAQEVYIPQSLALANQIGTALSRANLPLAMGRVALRPLDNLMCPALSVEIGPLRGDGSDLTPVSDDEYQQRVADAIAGALIFWKNQAQPPSYAAPSVSAGPGL